MALYGAKRKGKNCVYRIEEVERTATEEVLPLPSSQNAIPAGDEG